MDIAESAADQLIQRLISPASSPSGYKQRNRLKHSELVIQLKQLTEGLAVSVFVTCERSFFNSPSCFRHCQLHDKIVNK